MSVSDWYDAHPKQPAIHSQHWQELEEKVISIDMIWIWLRKKKPLYTFWGRRGKVDLHRFGFESISPIIFGLRSSSLQVGSRLAKLPVADQTTNWQLWCGRHVAFVLAECGHSCWVSWRPFRIQVANDWLKMIDPPSSIVRAEPKMTILVLATGEKGTESPFVELIITTNRAKHCRTPNQTMSFWRKMLLIGEKC